MIIHGNKNTEQYAKEDCENKMNKIFNTQATYMVSVDQAVTFGAEKAVLSAIEHYNIKFKKNKMTYS